MENDIKWLEEPVYEYIKNNQDKCIDCVDIVCHFKLRADITLKAVSNLEDQNKVKRVYDFGVRYKYITA